MNKEIQRRHRSLEEQLLHNALWQKSRAQWQGIQKQATLVNQKGFLWSLLSLFFLFVHLKIVFFFHLPPTHYLNNVFSRSVVSDSLWLHGLQPTRLLCPWKSPGRNTGVGCHSLLQGVFLTQGSNPGLLIAGRFFTSWATKEAHFTTQHDRTLILFSHSEIMW